MATAETQSSAGLEHVGTLVIGGGLAAAHCVHALREGGYRKSIMIVGDENEIPYERPPLSKEFLQGKKPVEEFQPFPAQWYVQADVELRLGVAAIAIDAEARQVTLADATTIGYETLVLATGCRSRMDGQRRLRVGTYRVFTRCAHLMIHAGSGNPLWPVKSLS